jgi:hypothetical protein
MGASATNSNRRVRTRTHGGVAGSAGDRRPYADLTGNPDINTPTPAHFKAGLHVGHPEKIAQNRACATSVGHSLQSNSPEEFEEMG